MEQRLRTNLTEQLQWLGSCQSWADAFGKRFNVETLNKRSQAPLEAVQGLSIEKDWRPLWERAAAGSLNGGEVLEPRRAAKSSEKTRSGEAPVVSGEAVQAAVPPNQFTRFTPRQARQVPVVHQVHVQLPEARPNSVWCMPPPSTIPPPNANSRPASDLRDWAQSFPWDQEVNEALPKFGVPAFRPQQREAINACLAGKDVFVRMPTGGGKSLVYQIPAVVKPLVVVISPLLSLIHDQVQELIQLGIQASAIRSRAEDSGEDVRTVTQRMLADELQIVYVTPELMDQSGAFQKALRSLYADGRLQRFVIDEAHCLSTWGNEFRESYLKLNHLKTSFPNVPILACSATATEEIIQNVLKQLDIAQDCTIFLSPVDRPNLEFKVLPKSKKSIMKEIGELIQTRFRGESGIIYCLSKQNCEDVQQELSNMHIRAEVYHAQVAAHQRAAVQRRWKAGETPIIVATIAFGMGVNKRDVRFVIHHSFPKSLEGYYQEAGRAGRDGRPATSIIFYDYEDKKRHQNMAQSDMNQAPEHMERSLQRLLQMVAYCEENYTCRRAFIINYFDEQKSTLTKCQPPGAICDICRMASKGLCQVDVIYEAQLAVQLLRSARQLVRGKGVAPLTLHSVKDALLGSKAQKMSSWQNLPGFGSLREGWTEAEVLRLLRRLIVKSILAEEITTPGGAAGCVTVAYLIEGRYSESLLHGEIPIQLCREEMHQPKGGVKRKLKSENESNVAVSPDIRNRNRRLSTTQIRKVRQRQREKSNQDQMQPMTQQIESQPMGNMPQHPAHPQYPPPGIAYGHLQQQNFGQPSQHPQQQTQAGATFGHPQQQNFMPCQQQHIAGIPQQQTMTQGYQQPQHIPAGTACGQPHQHNVMPCQHPYIAGIPQHQQMMTQPGYQQSQQQTPDGTACGQPQQQNFLPSQQQNTAGIPQHQQMMTQPGYQQSQQQAPDGTACGQPQQHNVMLSQQQYIASIPQHQQMMTQPGYQQSQQQTPAGTACGQPQQHNFSEQQFPENQGQFRASHGINTNTTSTWSTSAGIDESRMKWP